MKSFCILQCEWQNCKSLGTKSSAFVIVILNARRRRRLCAQSLEIS